MSGVTMHSAPWLAAVVSELDPTLRDHALRVIEWVAPDDEDIDGVSGAQMLYFTWYQLPMKMGASPAEMAALAQAAAELMRATGKTRIAELITSTQTATIHAAWHRDRREAVAMVQKALASSGVEPPDTDLLAWGTVMGIDEARARLMLAAVLETAIDTGVYMPGRAGWRRTQANVAEAWLTTRSIAFDGAQPLDAIHAERKAAWARGQSPAHRAALAPVLPLLDAAPLASDTEAGPLRWLLELVGDGVTLTQAGYLPTSVVADAKQWYAEWLLPGFATRSESDLPPLMQLHEFAAGMKLLTKRHRRLTVSAAGKAALTTPGRLDSLAAAAWFGPTEFVAAVGEVAAGLLLQRQFGVDELIVALWTAVAPRFRAHDGGQPERRDVEYAYYEWLRVGRSLGYVVETFRLGEREHLTSAGRSAAIAGLRARAHGPRFRP
jgi:hypothetical protein